MVILTGLSVKAVADLIFFFSFSAPFHPDGWYWYGMPMVVILFGAFTLMAYGKDSMEYRQYFVEIS